MEQAKSKHSRHRQITVEENWSVCEMIKQSTIQQEAIHYFFKCTEHFHGTMKETGYIVWILIFFVRS